MAAPQNWPVRVSHCSVEVPILSLCTVQFRTFWSWSADSLAFGRCDFFHIVPILALCAVRFLSHCRVEVPILSLAQCDLSHIVLKCRFSRFARCNLSHIVELKCPFSRFCARCRFSQFHRVHSLSAHTKSSRVSEIRQRRVPQCTLRG